MSTSPGQTTDSRAFLQHRVAVFGLTVSVIVLLALLARLIVGVVFGYWREELRHASFWAHVVAVVPVGLVWLVCRGRSLQTTTIQIVEGVGLVLTSAAFVVMGANIPAAAGAATTTAYALSFGLIARAIFVPSKARHTAWLGFAIGVPLVIAVYLNFLRVDLDVWNSHGFFRRIEDPSSLARAQAIQITFVWGLTTLLAAWASRVIYGLRKDVRDAMQLGQYTVEEKLGEGGMGTVYRAQHGMLKRPTAVKLLSPQWNAPQYFDQFRREVQMTAKLRHPNTVTIYDYGRTADGTFYYAMELLDGVTLEEVVKGDGELPESRAIHVLRECAMALEEAHSIGLVHRDVKPNNIMLTKQGGLDDVTKILDFGLVKRVDADAEVTKTWGGAIKGTPAFMSPEQILEPESIDGRSDIYSLGAVGYYMLTGRLVFDGPPVKILAQHLSGEPSPLSEVTEREFHPELERIIMQCLEKRRADRPPSCAEVADLLSAVSIEPWSQRHAALWWDTVGEQLMAARKQRTEVGTLDTIQAGPGFSDDL